MLGMLRRFADTWIAKIFFVILVGAFGLWGVADVVRNAADDKALAVVGSKSIELPEAQDAYRRQLAQVTRMLGTEVQPTADMRKAVAGQALERLVTGAALDDKAQALGLAVPDEALRQAVFDMPAFRGRDGKFDRTTFVEVLRSNGFTEKRFLDAMRDDLGQKQLVEAVRAAAASPEVLTNIVYSFQREERVAQVVDFPFAAATPPAAPTDAQLDRFYANNTTRYQTPELRHIKAVVLAPETLASEISISDADIATAYEARKSEFNTEEKRSVQVLLAQDEGTAKRLAADWQAMGDKAAAWDDIQAEASKSGASGVALDQVAAVEFPAPELGEAVFKAAQDVIPAPVHSALGWHVLKVTAISPGSTKSLAEMTPMLRARLLADRATDLMYERANKVEDQLAAGIALDNLPGDLGLAAVSGTMDAQGNTKEGKPAPIPGPAELRPALVQAAFQAKPGDTPHIVQAPNGRDGEQSFYAVSVDQIIPPATQPLAEVADRVRADWMRDTIRHGQEEQAAAVLTAVKAGKSLADVAAAQSRVVRTLPATGRAATVAGVPTQLIAPLFSLKPGEATMVETEDGFEVAVLDRVIDADPAKDPAGVAQIHDAVAQQMANDIEQLFVLAVRNQVQPKVNRAMLETLAQGDAAPDAQ